MPVEIDAFDFQAKQNVEEANNPDPARDAVQQATRREFQKRKKQAVDKAKKKVTQKVAKKLATKGIIRVVAVACGATGVGLVVTYGIWTVQAFAGNLMGSKLIPKLELGELILWGLVGIILFIALIILMFIAIIAFAFSNPFYAGGIIGGALVKSIMGS